MENSNLMNSMTESEENNWALFSHLGILGAMVIPFGSILLPLIIWQIHKDKSEYITEHAKEALNFQLTMLVIYTGCALMCLILIGFPMLVIAGIMHIIFTIIAATKASSGEYYDYPFNFRMIA